MSNGSELALRIALSDLKAKYQRSEASLKYMEECRNEMIKEIFRLRKENKDLVNENALLRSLDINSHLTNHSNGLINTADPLILTHRQPIADPQSVNRSSFHISDDQDVESITRKLVEQLHEFLKKGSPLQERNEDETVDTSEDTGVVGNKSVGSELLVGNQPNTGTGSPLIHSSPSRGSGEGREVQQQQQQLIWNQRQEHHQDDPDAARILHPDATTTRRHGLRVSATSASGSTTKTMMMTTTGTIAQENEADSIPEPDTHPCDKKNSPVDLSEQMYAKIIAALTSDLNRAAQKISSQNEKLAKLKSKQLRSYFRRQLRGDDQNSGTSCNSGSNRCHFEH